MKSERHETVRSRGRQNPRLSRGDADRESLASWLADRWLSASRPCSQRLTHEQPEVALLFVSPSKGAPEHWHWPEVYPSVYAASPEPSWSRRDVLQAEQTPARDPRVTAELARMEEEIRTLREEIAEVKAAFGWHDDTVVPLDPWQAWINAHPEEIARYPDQHLAIHPERGIVHHDADGRAFAAWYRGLSEEEADTYLITTSSMCL